MYGQTHDSTDCPNSENALILTDKILVLLVAIGLLPEALSDREFGVDILIHDIIAEHLE